jgi:aminoglycoside phosphotransferase
LGDWVRLKQALLYREGKLRKGRDVLNEQTRIPVPSDVNTTWKLPADLSKPLTAFQEAFVLSSCPRGTRIVSARLHRTVQLPCPIWVDVTLPNGEASKLILRMNYILDGVEKEAAILPWLARSGLPVPTVLAGPVVDPTQPEAGAMTILNVLPGQDFLEWGRTATPAQIQWAIGLILQGVDLIHGATEFLQRSSASQLLLRKTLSSELQAIMAKGGPWLSEPVFKQAVTDIALAVSKIETPLAFSSGDYNQGNFLFEGERLTGIIDISSPCFEDPHISMAMYWIYCWDPYDQAGIVERYLEQQRLSFADFAPRLALRCLRTLQENLPVRGGEEVRDEWDFESLADYRQRVLGLLKRAIDAMNS